MPVRQVIIPDIGSGDEEVTVVDIPVSIGTVVQKEQTVVVVESSKSSIEIPSPSTGVVKEICLKVGDRVKQGALILLLDEQSENDTLLEEKQIIKNTQRPVTKDPNTNREISRTDVSEVDRLTPSLEKNVLLRPHASPSVRRLAREQEIDLSSLKGSGLHGRITKEDVLSRSANSEKELSTATTAKRAHPEGKNYLSEFGKQEECPLTHIQRLSGKHLQTSWKTIPHVTHFDEVDITELESFRKSLPNATVENKTIKITLLSFLLKATALNLRQFPRFCAELSENGESLIYKHYIHIGFAVNTNVGLVVPVIRDVDQKSVRALSEEVHYLTLRARDNQLSRTEMQGGCFTISSLGAIGGTHFTPIVNAPEVAILGISKAALQPVYRDGDWISRLVLPFSLSYDHRAIDGVAAGLFVLHFRKVLSGIYNFVTV